MPWQFAAELNGEAEKVPSHVQCREDLDQLGE